LTIEEAPLDDGDRSRHLPEPLEGRHSRIVGDPQDPLGEALVEGVSARCSGGRLLVTRRGRAA